MNNITATNVPERLITKADLKVGDVLVFRPLSDLLELEKASILTYGWNTAMNVLLDNEYTVTEEILGYAGEKIAVHEIDGWKYYIGVSMLKLKPCEGQNEGDSEVKEEKVTIEPSIKAKSKDPAIIAEMKQLVDKKRLKTLLSISASYENNIHIVSDSIVEKYLDIWAYAKYEYFILFGKQLRVEQQVEVDMDEQAIKLLIKELVNEFPIYGYAIEQFNYSEYLENVIKYNHDIYRFSKNIYKRGMKLSKFFSSFFNDNNFDIALSKVMQNKKAVHNVYASIDPYDYLTMSLNQHDWDSCHRITDGCYGTGPLSYMLDDATMIAYRENGKEYQYNYYNLKFKGNSKSWRQCIYFDKASCSMIFGRQYPNQINDITKAIRVHLEDIVAEAIKAPNNIWRVLNNSMDGIYEDDCSLHYSDVDEGYDYKFVKLKDSTKEAFFYVGYEAPCLMCGGSGDIKNGGMGLCCDCLDDIGYED